MLPRKERVMLYTAVPRLFRSTYIGYVYEISQKFPFILLAERLDPESEKALQNKKWFPYLEKVVRIDQYTGKKRGKWESHRYFSRLAKKIIEEYKPDIVMGGSIVNAFEKYLFRYAQLSKATTVAIQAGFQPSSWEQYDFRYYLLYRDTPKNLKRTIFIREVKLLFTKLQIHLNELIDYWIFPLLLGTYPFFNKSIIKLGANSWVREFDYSVVFSDKEVSVEKTMGRPNKNIFKLSHPLLRESRKIFENAYGIAPVNAKHKRIKNITIMIDVNTYGHRRDNFRYISENDYLKSRIATINMISSILSDQRIFIKPHPTTKSNNFLFLKEYFEKYARNVSIVDPAEPADKYITLSDIVVGFPTPSTTLMTTMYQNPNKIIIYIDLHKEFTGDEFRRYPVINTIENMQQLKHLLLDIKNGRYKQKSLLLPKYKYKSAIDILDEVVKIRKIPKK